MLTNKGLIEGIIFASPQPVTLKILSEVLGVTKEECEALVAELKTDYENSDRGFFLAEIGNGFQFRTKPELKEPMAKFNEQKPPRLTQATLEVLSIIAYKQPITRPQIEKIRGVDCTAVLKTLLERSLIAMEGRSELPGHPVVYGTTSKFLEWFQIKSLQDLPPLSEMEVLNQGIEQGTENLLGLLNRDDGFTSESLADMDQTLQTASRQQIVTTFENENESTSSESTEETATAEAEDSLQEIEPNSHELQPTA